MALIWLFLHLLQHAVAFFIQKSQKFLIKIENNDVNSQGPIKFNYSDLSCKRARRNSSL